MMARKWEDLRWLKDDREDLHLHDMQMYKNANQGLQMDYESHIQSCQKNLDVDYGDVIRRPNQKVERI